MAKTEHFLNKHRLQSIRHWREVVSDMRVGVGMAGSIRLHRSRDQPPVSRHPPVSLCAVWTNQMQSSVFKCWEFLISVYLCIHFHFIMSVNKNLWSYKRRSSLQPKILKLTMYIVKTIDNKNTKTYKKHYFDPWHLRVFFFTQHFINW